MTGRTCGRMVALVVVVMALECCGGFQKMQSIVRVGKAVDGLWWVGGSVGAEEAVWEAL